MTMQRTGLDDEAMDTIDGEAINDETTNDETMHHKRCTTKQWRTTDTAADITDHAN